MRADSLELIGLSIAEMNLAFIPTSEAFQYRNPGKLKEANGNLRQFTTWCGGFKSLISELSRFNEKTLLLSVLEHYGCNTVEKDFIALDYLTQALGRTITASSAFRDVEIESNEEN